ncbi:MAG: ATP-binding cassette domain-containing protein, partial [Desulfosarcina sp.]
MTQPLIRVEGITVRLGDRWLLHDTSWRIDRGEQWAVVGPNGAGKTTLAKAIAGLVPVVRGKIDYPGFAGLAPMDAIAYVASDARRNIWRRERNLAHQRGFAGRFNDATTVRELIGRQSGGRLDRPTMARRLTDVVDSLSLENLLNKPALAISTGEMSRVLVACQLVRQPKMLILDEPFEGLDSVARGDLIERFDRLARSGLAIVLIVHRCEEMLPATT